MQEELVMAIKQLGIVRPSTIKRVELCPWSFKMCMNWESSSKEADRGTELHCAVWNDEAFEKLKGKDKEVVERIREDFVKKDKIAGYDVYHEVHVTLSDEEGFEITEGTLDYVAITKDGRFARIIDFKFGSLAVDKGPWNEQLKIYAAALFQELRNKYRTFAERPEQVKEVSFAILQPEISWDIYDEDIGTIDEQGCKEIAKRAIEVVKKAYEATEESAVPGQEQCRFCNKKECAMWKKACLSAISLIGKDEQSKMLAHPGAFLDTKMGKREMMEYADEFMCKISLLENAVKEAKEKVSAWVLEQGGSPSFGVVEGRKMTKTDWKALSESLAIPEDVIEHYTTTSYSKPYLRQRTRKNKLEMPDA